MNRLTPITLVLSTTLGCWLGGVQAQAVYRIVGPDGKVTYADRAPSRDTMAAPDLRFSGATVSNADLPPSLRKIAARFPVTLYTSADCAPCASARSFLLGRGIPFNERTIGSPDDLQAFQRLTGGNSLPLCAIGSQQLRGFAPTEWAQYLNAAGYPAQSQLPPTYRPPAPLPMVAQPPEPVIAPVEKSPDHPITPEAWTPRPSPNPTGIRF